MIKNKSIFTTCQKCKQIKLKSEKTHSCIPFPKISKSNKRIKSCLDSYTDLSRILSYKIIPDIGIDETLRVMQQMVIDLEHAKTRTVAEEIYLVFMDVKKPLSEGVITSSINNRFGFPKRKIQDIQKILSDHKNPFIAYDGYNMWTIKSWVLQA